MPSLAIWEHDPMVTVDSFQDVFNPAVELGNKSSCSGFLPHGRLATFDIPAETNNLSDGCRHQFQLDINLLPQLLGGHSNSLP